MAYVQNQIFAQNVIGNYVNQLKFDIKQVYIFVHPILHFDCTCMIVALQHFKPNFYDRAAAE